MRSLSPSKRMRILERDGFKCRYCGAAAPDVTLEIDHVIPVARGGSDRESNLVTSCNLCNRGKSAKLMEPAEWDSSSERIVPRVARPIPARRFPGKRKIGHDHPIDYMERRGINVGDCPWCGEAMYERIGGSVKPRECEFCQRDFHGIDCLWEHRKKQHAEVSRWAATHSHA